MKTAKVDVLGDDQGGGGSFCGNCGANVTMLISYNYDWLRNKNLKCPKCGATLVGYGNITPYPFGGSDYD
jgi:ribosomal protein S27AE